MGEQYHIKLDSTAASSIDQYLEYKRIVGNDDGGKLFTPEEYEEYKRNVLPIRLKNRLYVSWTSPSGMDCKLIGPETLCFCQHRYKQHKSDFKEIPAERPIHLPCKVRGCKCASYNYVPRVGSQPIRCRCKHTSEDHSESSSHKCKIAKCNCVSFRSSYTCTCTQPAFAHDMVVETKEERLARGHPVGRDVPYAAMGGITGFSSLAEGYMRLDDSGVGTPDDAFLNQPITSSDHPFLKMHASTLKTLEGQDGTMDQVSDELANFKFTGTDADMEYYEKRYQQRLKEEKARARGISGPTSIKPNPHHKVIGGRPTSQKNPSRKVSTSGERKPDIHSRPRWKTFLLKHCKSLTKTYWPTIWCIGAHLQTVVPTIIQSVPQHSYRREFLSMEDGGEICLHWEDNEKRGKMYDNETRPTVIILPGLTGCSEAGYVLQMVDSVTKLGYRAVVFNNRGLGGAQLKTPRTYSATSTDDLKMVIEHVHDLYPRAPLIAAGASLGGIILLNYLAKEGDNTCLKAAFAVSAAWNMFESNKEIEKPMNRWLLNYPLALGLRKVLLRHASKFKDILDPNDLQDALKATTIRQFDSSFTSKVFGYADVNAYYEDACLHKKIHCIKIPTLCLNAGNDPFSPVRTLPINDCCAQDNVALIVTSHGGHLGFLENFWPRGKSLWHCIFSDVIDAVFKHGDEISVKDC